MLIKLHKSLINVPYLNLPHIYASYLTSQTFLEAVVLINIYKGGVINQDERGGR